ncbi:hypothetical protein L226DRAFT_562421 [Lentinus tigrinus ALCF2SS1-7]|uniref:uncharacterized protein n=1 Tax=Lentinus tigrinus ALCF2SS1-7 TaxID=1328758 RepID=UPI001165D94A|nr:hypothetical protein L226DRAFT_562421 [Lentinus tigrinus ALCF2SS1-7]
MASTESPPKILSQGPSVAVSTARVGRSRKRLTNDAYNVLSAFFDNVSRFPSDTQCRELADAIRALPRCEWCTPDHLRRYFQGRRSSRGSLRVKQEQSSGLILKFYAPPPEGSSPSASCPVKIEEDACKHLVSLSAPLLASLIATAPAGGSSSTRVPAELSEPTLLRPSSPEVRGSARQITGSANELTTSSAEQGHWKQPAGRPFYAYAYPMLYSGAYMPCTPLRGPFAGTIPQHHPYHTSMPSASFASKLTTTQPATIPVLAPLTTLPPALSSTFSSEDPRLRDLASQLACALADLSATTLPGSPDVPKTVAALAQQLGDQKTSKDFLRALDGSVYARLGLLPPAGGCDAGY